VVVVTAAVAIIVVVVVVTTSRVSLYIIREQDNILYGKMELSSMHSRPRHASDVM
jgi:hypothetical protein